MKTLVALAFALAFALALMTPPAAAVNSVCTPNTFAFIDPMPRACASWSLSAVCVSARLESTLTECVPLP